MSRDVGDPRLSELVEGIVRIAGGELDTRIKASAARDELDAVIAGFNLMAEELMVAQGELESRVKTRTAMLMDAYRKMELMALTDPLTQLRNRSALETALETSLAETEFGGAPALLLLDLDSFKGINDTLGHSAGDAVLKIVAERLRGCVRKADTVARLGGDEFAVVLQDTSVARAQRVARRIITALAQPVTVDDKELSVGASVGIATPRPDDSALDLMLYADTAMYSAKRDPSGSVVVFNPVMLSVRQMHSALAAELRQAIERNQLLLHHQPIVELATGALIGVEALVRWQHPLRGLLMPDEFIELAEEIGAMTDLTAWVLRTALAQVHQWRETLELDPRFTMRVNISATQLQRPELLDDVRHILATEDISASALVLELTESALVAGNEWDAYSFTGLRQLGVGLAVDDFGTGYSSISYLRTLPVDAVKLDRSLIGSPGDSAAQRPFIAAILQLVSACKLTATFEGVETREQAALLTDLGCESAQGYYFSRPVPAEQINADLLAQLGGTPWLVSDPVLSRQP
ncbi:diguanylate phosphodiesterase [Arthrobacter livingstonensis]|uniref:Diguanylate phosphodiesterase n=1 Tax=Arthrobacter livingstonensis TaxID=670078 RepID=A0A2V5L3X9_9MICC|nr:EAL domain-containing protein [Arthrobacter livingstonensis]PYI65828.1 diguanylate phosphodiesterase [Arthrobacter livingstonensis]